MLVAGKDSFHGEYYSDMVEGAKSRSYNNNESQEETDELIKGGCLYLTYFLTFFLSVSNSQHSWFHYHFSLVVFHRVSFGLDLPHITIQHVASRGMADRIRIDPARWKSGERKPRNDRPDGNGRWIKGLWYYNILCCTVSTQRSQVASLYLRVEPRHIHAFLPCNLYRHMKLVSPSPYQRR